MLESCANCENLIMIQHGIPCTHCGYINVETKKGKNDTPQVFLIDIYANGELEKRKEKIYPLMQNNVFLSGTKSYVRTRDNKTVIVKGDNGEIIDLENNSIYDIVKKTNTKNIYLSRFIYFKTKDMNCTFKVESDSDNEYLYNGIYNKLINKVTKNFTIKFMPTDTSNNIIIEKNDNKLWKTFLGFGINEDDPSKISIITTEYTFIIDSKEINIEGNLSFIKLYEMSNIKKEQMLCYKQGNFIFRLSRTDEEIQTVRAFSDTLYYYDLITMDNYIFKIDAKEYKFNIKETIDPYGEKEFRIHLVSRSDIGLEFYYCFSKNIKNYRFNNLEFSMENVDQFDNKDLEISFEGDQEKFSVNVYVNKYDFLKENIKTTNSDLRVERIAAELIDRHISDAELQKFTKTMFYVEAYKHEKMNKILPGKSIFSKSYLNNNYNTL